MVWNPDMNIGILRDRLETGLETGLEASFSSRQAAVSARIFFGAFKPFP